MKESFIITIDGPAASGKGTIAKNISEILGYNYLSTGNIYRAVAKLLINNSIDYNNIYHISQYINDIDLNRLNFDDINNEKIGAVASIISAYSEVRTPLVYMQKEYIKIYKNIIIEGRDTGSVICPDANVKFFLTANIETRAKRRFKELQKQGIKVMYNNILEELKNRDNKDINRSISPLVIPDGAIEVDSTYQTREEITEFFISTILKAKSSETII